MSHDHKPCPWCGIPYRDHQPGRWANCARQLQAGRPDAIRRHPCGGGDGIRPAPVGKERG